MRRDGAARRGVHPTYIGCHFARCSELLYYWSFSSSAALRKLLHSRRRRSTRTNICMCTKRRARITRYTSSRITHHPIRAVHTCRACASGAGPTRTHKTHATFSVKPVCTRKRLPGSRQGAHNTDAIEGEIITKMCFIFYNDIIYIDGFVALQRAARDTVCYTFATKRIPRIPRRYRGHACRRRGAMVHGWFLTGPVSRRGPREMNPDPTTTTQSNGTFPEGQFGIAATARRPSRANRVSFVRFRVTTRDFAFRYTWRLMFRHRCDRRRYNRKICQFCPTK